MGAHQSVQIGRATTGNGLFPSTWFAAALAQFASLGQLGNITPGYAAPMLVTLEGERQLIVCMETNALGLNLDNGAVRWSFPGRVLNNQLPIVQPVRLATNRFLLSEGCFTGCTAFEVIQSDGPFTTRELWRSKAMKNKFSSSVF